MGSTKIKKKVRSKKYQERLEGIERNKVYNLNDAIEVAKKASYTKFDGTIEIHINTTSKNVRGLIALPFAAGKKLKVIAFGKGAQDSGADIIGNDEELGKIEKGRTDFDVLVTTAEWMPKLARAAKVLGPRGLMPNPKNGTITEDLKKAITEIQSGKVEYKSEKGAQVIHLGLGKVSQPSEQVYQNVKVLLTAIGKSKVKKATLAPTMGPGVKIDLGSV